MPQQFRHLKTGNIYTVLAIAQMQAKDWGVDMQDVVVYQGSDGRTWVRPMSEFHDRFERV